MRNTRCTKRVWALQIGLVAMGFALLGCRSTPPVGPPLERVEQWNKKPVYRVGTEADLLQWLESGSAVSIIHTPEDRWPNDFAVCMSPFLVDWAASDVSGSTNEFVIVHNVQVGGNPLLGTSRYATIRIPEGGIERVEFVIVRYYLKGLAKTSGHIQLRFVFKQDQRPELLDENGKLDREQPYLDDLFISWEAWRPTNTPWEFVAGLDPEQYALTARMYSGSQRFLNDSLRGAVWDCYPLNLPDAEAADMLLWDGLLMGDSLTRRTILDLHKDASDEIKKKFAWQKIPDDPLKDLLKDTDLSYHALERSCITIALVQIEMAMQRIYADRKLGERPEIKYTLGEIPEWFNNVAKGNVKFRHSLEALFWARHHKQILPYKAYLPLEEAGMLQTDKKGKIIMYRYGHKIGSPYGSLSRNLM